MQTKDPKRQRHLTPVWMKDMSFYDAWKINAMYKCASKYRYLISLSLWKMQTSDDCLFQVTARPNARPTNSSTRTANVWTNTVRYCFEKLLCGQESFREQIEKVISCLHFFADFAKRRCINVRDDCEAMKDRCESEKHWMWKYCRKTCERCYIAE